MIEERWTKSKISDIAKHLAIQESRNKDALVCRCTFHFGTSFRPATKDEIIKNTCKKTFTISHRERYKVPAEAYHMGKWLPNLVFAKNGEIYTINGLQYLVIGGAYSVDKYYRLSRGWSWWPDEQPSPEIKAYVEQQIREKHFDIVLSHTCPFKYEPTEMFLDCIDQCTVDDSTERWLDTIEESIQYKAWFCGHWHTDKRIDKMHFLFRSFESDEQFKR